MYLTIWVASGCNLDCGYCYEGNNKNNRMLSITTADKILEYIKNNTEPKEHIDIIFHGGEPLLNFEIIKYIVEKLKKFREKLSFSLTTNGTIMNQEISNFLVQNFNHGISISIDGPPNVHNRNRIFLNGQGSFEVVMHNIKTYFSKEYYQYLTIRMTLTSEMVEHLFDSCMFLLNNGFSTIITALDHNDKYWTDDKFEILKMQIEKLYKKSVADNYEENAIYFSLLDWNNKRKGECKITKSSFVVDVNGEVYPCIVCVGDKSLVIGNIYINPLEKIEVIEYLQRINREENKECQGCKHKEFCISSRCKFINKSITGDFLTPSAVECAYQNMIVNFQTNFGKKGSQ